jgi:hypothetical protein
MLRPGIDSRARGFCMETTIPSRVFYCA